MVCVWTLTDATGEYDGEIIKDLGQCVSVFISARVSCWFRSVIMCVHVAVYMPVCVWLSLCICLCLCVCRLLTVAYAHDCLYLCVCLSICVSVCVVVCLSVCVCVSVSLSVCVCVYRSLAVAHADQVLAVHLCNSVPRHCHQGACHLQHSLHVALPHLTYHLQGPSQFEPLIIHSFIKPLDQ